MESIKGTNLNIVYIQSYCINLCLTEHSERKYVFVLFAVNILISAIILVIVGLNCKYHAQQPFKLTHRLKSIEALNNNLNKWIVTEMSQVDVVSLNIYEHFPLSFSQERSTSTSNKRRKRLKRFYLYWWEETNLNKFPACLKHWKAGYKCIHRSLSDYDQFAIFAKYSQILCC